MKLLSFRRACSKSCQFIFTLVLQIEYIRSKITVITCNFVSLISIRGIVQRLVSNLRFNLIIKTENKKISINFSITKISSSLFHLTNKMNNSYFDILLQLLRLFRFQTIDSTKYINTLYSPITRKEK